MSISNEPLVTFREKECSSCMYFDRALFEGFEAEIGPGYCRRYPPVLYSSGGKSKQSQPVVSPWEWCGEWQKA